jgi:lipopolysaccharide/colanic/teichoic acid biosynthesis glycosyltransferase
MTKRLFDILLSSLIIVVLSPVLILIFLSILIERVIRLDFGPFLIKEPRVSKGKTFGLYKINMYLEKHRKEYVKTSPDYKKHLSYSFMQHNKKASLVLGNIYRMVYFDELGQLFNILKGDMSFVGPRPLPVDYPQNKELPRKLLLTGLVCFAANKNKNEGDTIVKYNTDDEYLRVYQDSTALQLLKIDLMIIVDGFRAMLKAKGY